MHHHSIRTNKQRSLKKKPTVEIRDESYDEEELNVSSFNFYLLMRRILIFVLVLAWIAAGLYAAALFTNHWAVVEFKDAQSYEIEVEVGIWGELETAKNWSSISKRWISHFKLPKNVHRLEEPGLTHYYRAQAVIGVIALVLLVLTNLLALFTFFQTRYVYKRFCACLYFVSAGCIFVTIEIMAQSIDKWSADITYEKTQSVQFSWEDHVSMGYSTRMAQGAILICLVAFLSFLFGSHMQKGDNAATVNLERADRPVEIKY